jgi:hypothetical protein
VGYFLRMSAAPAVAEAVPVMKVSPKT